MRKVNYKDIPDVTMISKDNKLKWWEYPTLFINNFEVKDPVGFDQRLTMAKLSELQYRKDRADSGGWKQVQLIAHPITSLTHKEKIQFEMMMGGVTIANEQLLDGYLYGDVPHMFPFWLMLGLLEKGIYPEPIFSTERVILQSND